MSQNGGKRMLDGPKEIASFLHQNVWGIPVSEDSIHRYSRLKHNALPVHFISIPGSKRRRMVADPEKVERWAKLCIRQGQ